MLGSIVKGMFFSGKAAKLPLVPPLTEQELTDYYKKALAYDSIVPKRDSTQNNYEINEVDEATKKKIIKAQEIVEQQLFRHNYVPGSVLLDSQQYYIKAVIDDKQLIKASVDKVGKAFDFYIIDVKYNIRPKSPGTILDAAKYLGIHGAFKQSGGKDYVDTNFLAAANNKVWEYLVANQKTSTINVGTETPPPPQYQQPQQPQQTQQEQQASQGQNKQEQQAQVAQQAQVQPPAQEVIPRDYGLAGRTPKVDVKLFNKVMGSSLTNTAYMPVLSIVFTPSGEAETIAGYGIYPEGNAGMRLFGFDRGSMDGTLVMRYLFKGGIDDVSKLEAIAAYPVSMEVKFNPQRKEVVVPDFVMTEIGKLIDRYDRAVVNNDITALMSGEIVRDVGIAIRNGFTQNYVYLTRHISKVNGIVDKKGSYYLVEVESLVQESPKKTQLYGTYKDKSLFVIEQQGSNFVINDILKVGRTLVDEPKLELDDSIQKHLAALNLSGAISEDSKKGIRELLNNLYKASTDRVLKGMYSCFNDDVNVLPSSKKEYLNSQLRGWLVKYGVDVKSTYTGKVNEWLGGSASQAELITDELIEYEGKDSGQYIKMYYLVSNFNGKWVIDDMKIIRLEDVSGARLAEIKQKLGQ
jgi:uncharacterized protein YnzC (UPF0291/DUF896 family)